MGKKQVCETENHEIQILVSINKWTLKWTLKFIGTQPCTFIYIVSMAAFLLWEQSWVDATETIWQNLKYLLSGLL